MAGPEAQRKHAQRLAEFRLRLDSLSAEEIERLLEQGRMRSPERITLAREVLAARRTAARPHAEPVGAFEKAAAAGPTETGALAEAESGTTAAAEREMSAETPREPTEEAIAAASTPAAAERAARLVGTVLTIALAVAIGVWLIKR
jgi:hypothetical protein